MKTLYIQITSSPAPEASADLVVYPADMSNYFCNYLEYELMDGLQMPDGMPCYKEMRPGSLLLAFAAEHEEAYQSILRQWENIQRDLLREAPAPDTRYEVTLPKEYIDWLLSQEGYIYQKVGEKLAANNILSLSAEDLYEEIITPMIKETQSYLQAHTKEFDQFTFSDNGIKSSFLIVKRLKQTDKKLAFIRDFPEWDNHSRLEFTVNGVSFTMIRVQAGSFYMGSDNGDYDERPMHIVTLNNDFYIGQFPVTQLLWHAIMGTNTSCSNESNNLPIEKVSWNDCHLFIHRLSELTQKKFHLPSEAQWEYAARGGIKSKGFKYAGGNNLDDVAWNYDNSEDKPHEVGTKQPNELGIYDMSGNVYEWCEDGYGPYPDHKETDPIRYRDNSKKVTRGSNYFVAMTESYSITNRYWIASDYRDYGVGFRLALTL